MKIPKYMKSCPEKKGKLEIQLQVHDGAFPEIDIIGDPEGLQYLASLLNWLAGVDQCENDDPVGTREHIHLHRNCQLGDCSCEVVLTRADAKGTGELPDFMK
ncbi:MAG: hypothetical protein KAJ07_00150 [Planctomycetes bacterium]|nr:hypothetical protein [Planctomycetota bacterium]